jgi:transcriptional regulator with PAS, ATPase and Fis domain
LEFGLLGNHGELPLHKKKEVKKMNDFCWFDSLKVAITVCDLDGKVLAMNDKAGGTFADWGGKDLIGKSLMDCHKPHSQMMIKQMMENDTTNAYTIEKAGVKKMIYQTPWYQDGQVAGLVEFSFEIPFEMTHHNRG